MKEKIVSIKVKQRQNYVAFFLTFACNLRCPYCINSYNAYSKSRLVRRKQLSGNDWVIAANRLILRDDLPLTLQGGEPTLHKDFYKFVNEVKADIKMDLLTNFQFDVKEFIKKAPVARFKRQAPYAAIRVSYHPGQNDINDLINKTLKMQDAGFRIGLYGILHPDEEIKRHILTVQEKCVKLGIDFRTKEFLGKYKGKPYGMYRYDGAISGKAVKYCQCRTSEIIVDPSGYVYRCHSDLYAGRGPVGFILSDDFTENVIGEFRECYFYGDCNPCDIKIKTNRFQIFNHTSVEIKNIKGIGKEERRKITKGSLDVAENLAGSGAKK